MAASAIAGTRTTSVCREMIALEKRKAALAKGQAAFLNTSNDGKDSTAPSTAKQRAKSFIVGAACWGLVPVSVDDGLTRRFFKAHFFNADASLEIDRLIVENERLRELLARCAR